MTEKYFDIYKFAHSAIGRVVRFGPVSIVVLLFLVTEQSREGLISAVASIGIFLINEIFLAVKVSRTEPQYKVDDKNKKLDKTMLFRARQVYSTTKDSYDIFEKLKQAYEVRFFLEKAGVTEVIRSNIAKDELLRQSRELAEYVKGNYITEIDLVASYLILAEEDTKVLSKHELSHEDVINIAYWSRKRFGLDVFEKHKLEFTGNGVFDSLVVGWNYETKKYTQDFTSSVFNSHYPPVITGHEDEFEQFKVAFSKSDNSSVILVGDPGVGKTSIVEHFAYQSFLGNLQGPLHHKRVYELFVDRLLAGVNNQGELEERLVLLFSEILHAGNTVIFIQNIESIFGGGGFEFDMSGVLAGYIESGRVKIIGTTTPGAYAAYIRDKASIDTFFDVLNVSEMDVPKSLLLLSEKAEEREKKSKVKILYSALKQSVLLAPIYYPGRFYPGSAVLLLDDVIAASRINKKKMIEGKDVVEIVKKKTDVPLAVPDEKEKEVLLNLEDKLHKRIIGQNEAVSVVASAMRRARSGFENQARPISVFLFLGPTGVGKTETAKALAAEYYGSEDSIVRINMNELQSENGYEQIIGSNSSYVHSLSEKVSQKPFSLILLDEFEKASSQVLNIFLQIFDEGQIDDFTGRSVSFKNTIIIATSNAGSELIRENNNIRKDALLDHLLRNNIFSPELLNRFDDVVLYKALTEDEIADVAKILLNKSFEKIQDSQIEVEYDDKVVKKVAHESYSAEFGARNVRRYIEENVEQFISDLILKDEIKRGDKVGLSVDETGQFVIR